MSTPEMNCPRCGKSGDVFINTTGYRAWQCVFCRLSWKEYDEDGSWELIVDQDRNTLEVETEGMLVTIEESAL